MKILGLDLGVASIGWALIEETKSGKNILGMGSRIIPYSGTEDQDFVKGIGVSKNQERTIKRTQRKGYDRRAGDPLHERVVKDRLLKANHNLDEERERLPYVDFTVTDYLKYLDVTRALSIKYDLKLQQIDMAIWQLDIEQNR